MSRVMDTPTIASHLLDSLALCDMERIEETLMLWRGRVDVSGRKALVHPTARALLALIEALAENVEWRDRRPQAPPQ